jgi:hypothetical protein
MGNLIPGNNARWIAPRSWEATWWVGIDVDYRGDQKDFKRRCVYVIKALKRLGVPREAILPSRTPSGGRHYRFFTSRKVRVSDIPNLLGQVGLHECPGKTELFPKMTKGMRLPFGYQPGRPHDPKKWLQFIRDYRQRRFPRVSWLRCLKRAARYAIRKLSKENGSRAPSSPPSRQPKPTKRPLAPVVVSCRFGLPKRLKLPLVDAQTRYRKLLAKPFDNTSQAHDLWHLGICCEGTRVEATKRIAWHMLFVRQLPEEVVANELVRWVYETGKTTSCDVRKDLANNTTSVETQIREYVRWLAEQPKKPRSVNCDRTQFSDSELQHVLGILGKSNCDASRLIVALHFLRFAKLHGSERDKGWEVQVAVRGVIRRWPGCDGMKYKPHIEALKACGFIEMVKEKRQSSNGTGRPRTYLVNVPPHLRSGAKYSVEESLNRIASMQSKTVLGLTAVASQQLTSDTYRRLSPPPPEEKQSELTREAKQEPKGLGTGHGLAIPRSLSDHTRPRDNQGFFRAEAARMSSLIQRRKGTRLTRKMICHDLATNDRGAQGPVDYGGVRVVGPDKQWHQQTGDAGKASASPGLSRQGDSTHVTTGAASASPAPLATGPPSLGKGRCSTRPIRPPPPDGRSVEDEDSALPSKVFGGGLALP